MLFKRVIIFLIGFFLFFTTCSIAEEGVEKGVMVTEAVICKGIINRTPQEPGEVFPSDVGKLFAFSRIEGATEDTYVKHLWFYNDNLMAEVSLPVRSPNWRTYSSKRILPSWKGQWRVDITTEDGLVLKSLHFTVE